MNMKKNIVLLAMIGFGLATLCSCGSKSVKGADGTEYSSYQEACRHQDFVAAYDWIEKNNGTDDDKDYVSNAEMLYLTSLGTDEASNRIIYLLAEYQILGEVVTRTTPNITNNVEDYDGELYQNTKEYINGIKRFNKRCDNVLDLAITQNNKELAKKIINLYKADINVIKDDARWGDLWFGDPILLYTSKGNATEKYNKAFGTDKEENVEEVNTSENKKKKRRRQ